MGKFSFPTAAYWIFFVGFLAGGMFMLPFQVFAETDFGISDYAGSLGSSASFTRGYAFQVSAPINVTHLRGGGTNANWWVALYEADAGDPTIPRTLLDSVDMPSNTRLQKVALVSPITLTPGTNYILAQGNGGAGGSHYNVGVAIDTSALEAGESWVEGGTWEPSNGSTYSYGVTGDPEDIIDSESASENTSSRIDVGLSWELASSAELEQEGFAFGDDDGSESAHTFNTQDTNITEALGTKTLRVIVDTTDDQGSTAYKLKYQKDGAGGYEDVPVGATTPSLVLDDEESFDNTFGDWTNETGTGSNCLSFDTNNTTSGNTGPSAPQDGTHFVYYETSSSACNGSNNDWMSYALSETSGGYVDFYYHMYGAGIGTLSLQMYDGDTWETFWSKTGAQEQTDELDAYTFVDGSVDAVFDSDTEQIRFFYTGATTFTGDAALDLVRVYITGEDEDNEVYVSTSGNVASGGESTTARLTAPSGKGGDFTTGRRWDDENGDDSIDIASDFYTELEWVLTTQSPATTDDYFEFRVYNVDIPLDTYTVTPRWTIGTGGGGGPGDGTPAGQPRFLRLGTWLLLGGTLIIN